MIIRLMGQKKWTGVSATLSSESYAVDIVVLMLGINDLKARDSVTPQDIALSVERLIREIRHCHVGPADT
ncbi:hypothetical protein PT286_01005 [Neisseriaceae bacterium ESL0693]|nr:hypothetical protein [Neisseriaceae bacterium ESL0693]